MLHFWNAWTQWETHAPLQRRSPGARMDAEAADLERKLFEVNHLPKASLEAEFLRCCGSRAWGQAMIEKMPFTSYASLLDTASLVWWHLPVSEWQMAFSAHPQIGVLLCSAARIHNFKHPIDGYGSQSSSPILYSSHLTIYFTSVIIRRRRGPAQQVCKQCVGGRRAEGRQHSQRGNAPTAGATEHRVP
jgi:hypothetical protein